MKRIILIAVACFYLLSLRAQQKIADFNSLGPQSQSTDFVIPSTHRFQKIIEEGDPLSEGGILPGNTDFTGFVPIEGSSENGYLSINSELVVGGVTILDIAYDSATKLWETTASQAVDFTGVGGTTRNCSGAVTPWNTIITCEERVVTSDINGDGYRDMGWAVEVDPIRKSVIDKRWALGNFQHENLIIHSNERTAYQGVDEATGYLYKFIADVAQDLSSGTLYVYTGPKNGSGNWALINNTTIEDRNTTLQQSAIVGGTVFSGIEDVEIGPEGLIYFAVKGEDQVYRFEDSDPLTGTTVVKMETYVGNATYNIVHETATSSVAWGGGNDNLAFDGDGNLWVLQDGDGDYIWVVKNGHTQANPQVNIFGRTPIGSEPTGITFSPDYRFLFMSIQHPGSGNHTTVQNDAADIPIGFDKDISVVIALSHHLGDCLPQGTPCDDGDQATNNDEEDGNCNCTGVTGTETVIHVAISSDDAEEDLATSAVDLTSSDLELIMDGEDQIVGIRYNNIHIPEGDDIQRAFLQFQTDEVSTDPTSLIIKGELADNSVTFTESAGDISHRNTTQNSIFWNDIMEWNSVGEALLDQRTPYVTSIVHEIITQPNWQNGNAITFVISGEGERVAEAFDGDVGPSLRLFFSTPCPESGTSCDDGDPNTSIDVEDGECNCSGIPESGTIRISVARGSDDAEQAETGGAMYLGSSDLELVYDTFDDQFNQTIGIRFNNIHLPSSAAISNAYIQFTVDETDSDATSLLIQGENSGNAQTFSSEDFDITNRSLTTTQIAWNDIVPWNTVGEQSADQQTPPLNSIVEEILQHHDWSALNSMAFIITGNGVRTAESYDGVPTSAPVLVIDYSFEIVATEDINAIKFDIIPNPSTGIFQLIMDRIDEIHSVAIFNAAGLNIIKLKNIDTTQRLDIDMSEYASGVYFISIKMKDGTMANKKIIKI